MDIEQAIQKYGIQAIEDAIDMVEIEQTWNKDRWRDFCLHHKLITRQTKHIYIRAAQRKTEEWYSLEGRYGRYNPQEFYYIRLQNGNKQDKFNIHIKVEEWKQFKSSQA
jgi:hypothetical protein